jgi:diguanylate cyclase (GGDEF)-like protein
MTQDQALLAILAALVVANVLLLASIPFRARRRRPGTDARVQAGSPPALAGRGDPRAAEDAGATEHPRDAAAIEAFVAGLSAGVPDRGRPQPASDAGGRRPEVAIGSAPPDTTVTRARWTRSELGRPSPTPEGTLAELADPAMWSRTIREEAARAARFGHPVTVVMAELPRLEAVAERLGRGVADRVVTEAARVLVTEGRAADRIAWLDDTRFGILLSETDEVAAGSYVERVRAATDGWLESTGLSLRLSLGWASSADGGDVVAAAAAAEQRMHDADGRSAPERKPHVAGRRNA